MVKVNSKKKNRWQSAKSALRKKLLKLLKSQKEEDRLKKSRAIQKRLFLTPEFKQAKVILFYASFNGEVETFRMMKQAQKLGKKIVLPTILEDQKKMILSLVENLGKDLVCGAYGISEPNPRAIKPVDLEAIDLAIVPGVAFDSDNNRLGRGAGYYDRFLVKLSSDVPTFGLAFDFQVLNRLPHPQKHDVAVSRVITN